MCEVFKGTRVSKREVKLQIAQIASIRFQVDDGIELEDQRQ